MVWSKRSQGRFRHPKIRFNSDNRYIVLFYRNQHASAHPFCTVAIP